ncbi:ligase-associated DNA damage response endonuclease PdeM [soil metagenome]
MDHVFPFRGNALTARASGSLWWPARRLLVVADLHLGRSERLARRGGALLPPSEGIETLDRLAAEVEELEPAHVLCLGDSFDDAACEAGLAPVERERLLVVMAGRDWIWLAGNHDPAPIALGGRHLREVRLGPLTFRHAAEAGAACGEVSGHYHPKARIVLKGRALTRRCFLRDERRVILPAFGAYTGGLWADHPSLAALMGAEAVAILSGRPMLTVPVWPGAARMAGSG